MLPDHIKSGHTPNIGVLINPLSGGNLKGLGSIRSIIADNPQVVHHDVQTPQDILEALLDFARRGVDLSAVNGGDGTVQAVLTNLFLHQPFSVMPLLAILQSGTTSMTARDVGFSGSRVKSLQKLFKWAFTGGGEPKVVQRPVLQVQAPGHQTYYGMFFGASAIYQGIEYCIKHGLELFEPGAQGEHKISRGFLPTPTWSAHWIKHPEFSGAIQHFLNQETQGMQAYIKDMQQRSPYKKQTGD